MASIPAMSNTTLVIQPETALGKALKLVIRSSALQSAATAIRLVEARPSASGASSSAITPKTDCIATNLGAAFVYIDSPERLRECIERNVPSFRLTVAIVNISKLLSSSQSSGRSSLVAKQLLMDFQMQSKMMNPFAGGVSTGNPGRQAILSVAHNAEEAAEYVMSLVTRLSDTQAVEQAKRWVMEAHTKANEAYDPKKQAFEIAEKGLPIPPTESRALLESVGSLLELAQIPTADQIALRSPLSDKDAQAVAHVLGIPFAPPSSEPIVVESQMYDNYPSSNSTAYPYGVDPYGTCAPSQKMMNQGGIARYL